MMIDFVYAIYILAIFPSQYIFLEIHFLTMFAKKSLVLGTMKVYLELKQPSE